MANNDFEWFMTVNNALPYYHVIARLFVQNNDDMQLTRKLVNGVSKEDKL